MDDKLRVTMYEFDGEEWTSESTCWQFAIGDNTKESRLVGDTIGKRVTASQIRKYGTYILRAVIEEELAANYGYFVEETEDAFDLPEEAEFKMAILISPEGMYHMMRMYPDGSWWRKWAGVQPTDVGPVTGGKIFNPIHECFDGYELFFMDVYRDW